MTHLIKSGFLSISLVFLLSLPLGAQEKVLLLKEGTQQYIADEYVLFYLEKDKQLLPEEVIDQAFAKQMKAYAGQNDSYEPGAYYWYRLKICNLNPLRSDFLFKPVPTAPGIDLYVFDQYNRLVSRASSGFEVPYSLRAWTYSSHIFPLKLTYGDTLTLVARARMGFGRVNFAPVEVSVLEVFLEKHMKFYPLLMFFQGAYVLMFFYNLFFFFVVRDRAYLYYALYVLTMVLVSIQGAYAFLEEFPVFMLFVVNFSALFVTLCYIQFIRYFFDIPQNAPGFNRYFSYWIFGRYVTIFFTIIFYIQKPALALENNFVQALFISDMLLGLWLIRLAWKSKPVLVMYLGAGYLAMAVPLTMAILKQLLYDGADPETDGILVQGGVVVELVVFSLGLGYRSKALEREKLAVSEENRRMIEEQNLFLEQKVTERTQELNAQKQALEEQNEHIMQNIAYAKRIQEAFLPNPDDIQKHLTDFFVLFKPRDVVSGDFYFVEEVEEKIIVAAVDCTGHGVSGAFVTVLANEILHKLVNEDRLTSPDLLLNQLHKGVRQALKQAEGENRDGMDLALLVIDRASGRVEFAGAHNPLLYIQNGTPTLLKADKMSIGGEQTEQERLFNKTSFDTADQPTMIYLFSDGFQDQFGGPQNKKFGSARLHKLLLAIHQENLNTQAQILEQTIEQWRAEGGEEQIDDVLVMGIKIS